MPPHNHNLYLQLHIITVYLSYAAFFAASAAAVLYLLQDRLLKRKQGRVIFNRLPDLFFLDRLNYNAIGIGFPILTVSMVSGFIWTKYIQGTYWSHNSREIYSLVLWLIYALILHVRLSAKLRGTKVAGLSLFALGVIVLTLFNRCF